LYILYVLTFLNNYIISHQAQQSNTPASQTRTKTEEELAEEEQLQLALAISQSEAEAKEQEAKKRNMFGYAYTPAAEVTSPQHHHQQINNDHHQHHRDQNNEKGSPQKSAVTSSESDDPELARYLNRGYWENRSENTKEETGNNKTSNITSNNTSTSIENNKSNNKTWNSPSLFLPSAPGEQAEEIDSFSENLESQIEMFVNRMKSNSGRGRPIAYDAFIQSLFMNITALHSQLLNFIQAQDNARSEFLTR
jgi:growth factor-regulated tyrosine kinase substrate